MQFINVHCTVNAKIAIKCLLIKERLSPKGQRDINFQIRKYHENPENTVKQYIKEKYVENRTSNIAYKKEKYQENSELRLLHQKCRYRENPESKKEYQKARCREHCEKQVEYQKGRYKENPA